MKKIRNVIFAVGVVGSLAGVIAALVLLAIGEWQFSYDAKITQLYVCNGVDPLTGLLQKPLVTSPVGTEQIYACGYLETSSPVRLGFLLFFENRYMCTFVADQKFDQGHFVKPLCVLNGDMLKPGLYRIDIYRGRNRLGSAEFKVTTKEP